MELDDVKRALENVEKAVARLRNHVDRLVSSTVPDTKHGSAPRVTRNRDGQIWIDGRLFDDTKRTGNSVRLEIAMGKYKKGNWRLAVKCEISHGDALAPVVDPDDPSRWLRNGSSIPHELDGFDIRPTSEVTGQRSQTLRAVIPLNDHMSLARFAAWAARARRWL